MENHSEWLEEIWKHRGEHWVKVEGDWNICPTCKTQPREWIFDNGRFAKCICFQLYDTGPVRSESIRSYVSRNSGSVVDYPRDDLRLNWNLFTQDGVKRNTLPVGQW